MEVFFLENIETFLLRFNLTLINEFLFSKYQGDHRIRLDYPFLQFFERKFFLPLHLYGVELDGSNAIRSVQIVHLYYPIPSTDRVSF